MNTGPMSLTEFLLARIVEDEAEARRMGGTDFLDGGWEGDHERKVLAECEAKRGLVIELDRMEREEFGWDGIERTVMTYLAQPYADHPEFREEWRA